MRLSKKSWFISDKQINIIITDPLDTDKSQYFENKQNSYICSKDFLDSVTHEQTITWRHLFAGRHMVGLTVALAVCNWKTNNKIRIHY